MMIIMTNMLNFLLLDERRWLDGCVPCRPRHFPTVSLPRAPPRQAAGTTELQLAWSSLWL